MGSKRTLTETYTCLIFGGRTLSPEPGMSIEMSCEGRIPAWTPNLVLSSDFEAIVVET